MKGEHLSRHSAVRTHSTNHYTNLCAQPHTLIAFMAYTQNTYKIRDACSSSMLSGFFSGRYSYFWGTTRGRYSLTESSQIKIIRRWTIVLGSYHIPEVSHTVPRKKKKTTTKSMSFSESIK